MIIQKVLKGISGITPAQARAILDTGIICNWWQTIGKLPAAQIPLMLTERNLDWHQNKYSVPDPMQGMQAFSVNTPFISVTAGTVGRNGGMGAAAGSNFLHPAWRTALKFATKNGKTSGCVFYCYVFIIGQKAIEHQSFSEEVRELNIYNGFSPFQLQGEITAKIIIPPAQIEKCEFFSASQMALARRTKSLPIPTQVIPNTLFQMPEAICNIRESLI